MVAVVDQAVGRQLMTPAERTMTVVRVEQQPDLTFRVHLPFRVATAVDEAHARRLVYGEACGATIKWIGLTNPTEAELRAMWGDR